MMEREDELYKLRGKTLQVYIYMLRAGRPVGVRELQRALGFSSPSVAHHHLEKLREMGLVLRDEGNRYLVQEKVDVGILKMFVLVGGRLIPRMVFYAVFITTLLAPRTKLCGSELPKPKPPRHIHRRLLIPLLLDRDY
jgi:DNA-binding transcriptional ArsR family regulator